MPDNSPENSNYQADSQKWEPLVLKKTRRDVNTYGITEDSLDNLSALNKDASILFSIAGFFLGVSINSLLCWILGTLNEQQVKLAISITLITLIFASLSSFWGYRKQLKQGTMLERIKKESIVI
jgi:hypothetical protein